MMFGSQTFEMMGTRGRRFIAAWNTARKLADLIQICRRFAFAPRVRRRLLQPANARSWIPPLLGHLVEMLDLFRSGVCERKS